jgi:hypothetical protein
MSAAWVLAVLLLLIDPPVPVVRGHEPPGGEASLFTPASFRPAENWNQNGEPLDIFSLSRETTWYMQAQAFLLDRTVPNAIVGAHLGPVGVDPVAPFRLIDLSAGDNRFLSTGDLDLSSRPGLRFLVGRTIWADPCDDRGCVAKPDEELDSLRALSLELGYLGLAQRYRSSVQYAASPNPPDGAILSRFAQAAPGHAYIPVLWPFDQASMASLLYRSRFDSAELNLRYSRLVGASLSSGLSHLDLLAGVRFVKVQENLDYLAASSTFLNTPVPMQTGLYSTRTDNDLIGLQLGGDLNYRLSSALSLVGRGRGGLLVNSASQRSNVNGILVSTGAGYNDIGAGSNVGLAGMFEFGIHTNYQVSPNLTLMIGYQGLFLSDLSTAPRQLNWGAEFGSRNGLERNGSLFFFGPAAGIEWRW